MKVYSFIGPIASGKTTMIESIQKNIVKLDENYIELDKYNIDNRLIISKWAFINSWFQRILECNFNNISSVVTDRCPYDAIPYAKMGTYLFNAINESFKELENIGIDIKIIYIRSDISIIQDRVELRIKDDIRRNNYHELDIMYLQKTIYFYESNIDMWHEVITNNTNLQYALDKINKIVI